MSIFWPHVFLVFIIILIPKDIYTNLIKCLLIMLIVSTGFLNYQQIKLKQNSLDVECHRYHLTANEIAEIIDEAQALVK